MTTTITYVSRPAPTLSAADVFDIWAESLERNETNEITGVLYFGGNMFLHVLEGEEDEVEPLFEKIKRDPRHQDVTVLSINDLASAMFHDTPMKLVDGSRSKFLQGKFVFEDLCDEGIAGAHRAVLALRKL